MRYLIILLFPVLCYAQNEPPVMYPISGYQLANSEIDTFAVVTMEQSALVKRIMVKVDSSWSYSTSVSFGISGRSLTLAEFGTLETAAYVDGTLVILVESGTVLLKGEIITMKLGDTTGDVTGRFEIYVDYTYYP